MIARSGRWLLLGFALALAWLAAGVADARSRATRFQLEAREIGGVYDIEVVVPADSTPPGTKYPVAYCLDWFMLGDYLKSLPRLMDMGRLTEPCILVGISQGSTGDDWATMRTRDFTPAPPSDAYSKGFMYPRAMAVTGGAPKFVRFLQDEILPKVEAQFPADPGRRCLVGYSLGGLLGVHLLTEKPELFQYFVLGSSSLWFNDYYLSGKLDALTAERLAGIRKIYLSVGADESWEMLKSFDILRAALKRKGFESARLKAEIIPDAGHVGAMPISLYNGWRFVFSSR